MAFGLGFGWTRDLGGGASFALDFTSSSYLSAITFSRGTTATLMGQNRLIQYAPANLLLNSNDFSQASWANDTCTLTANAGIAPDGTNTAQLITGTGTNFRFYQLVTTQVGPTYTFSFYVKQGTSPTVVIQFINTGNGPTFTFATGTWSALGGWTTSATNVGNGWWYMVVNKACTNVSSGPGYAVSGAGQSVYLWGCQMEQGTNASTYHQTTGTAYYGPRIDYDPTTLVAQNFFQQSDNLASSWWTTSNGSATANATVGPTGVANAVLLTEDTSSLAHQMASAFAQTANLTYVISVYAKANSAGRYLTITGGGISGAGEWPVWDLFGGTAAQTGATTIVKSVSIASAGNGWYRCSARVVPTNASAFVFALANSTVAGTSPSYAGNGTSGLYLWGAQLNEGGVALPYTATTTAAITQCAPLGLLVEEARTNQLLNSSDYTNASWAKTNVVAAVSAVLSPDGTAAQSLTATAAVATNMIVNTPLVASGTSYTYSVYMRAGTGNTVGNAVLLRNNTTATNLLGVTIDLGTGVLTYTVGATGATSTYVGNGWWRITLSVSAGITATDGLITYIGWTGGTAAAGDFIYAWGAQLEAGAFPTSYIPTAAAAVTRNADNATITPGAWYNQPSGTIVAVADTNNTAGIGGLWNSNTGSAPGNFVSGGNVSFGLSSVFSTGITSALSKGVQFKTAYSYIVSNHNACTNGSAVVNNTNATVIATPVGIGIGSSGGSSNFLNGHIKSLAYYNTALSNAQLQSLTT